MTSLGTTLRAAQGRRSRRAIDDRETAIQVARELVEEIRTASGQGQSGEVNPVKLACFLGVETREMKLNGEGVSAESKDYVNSKTQKSADSATIFVLVEESDRRPTRRFSVAHELGHLVWDQWFGTPKDEPFVITSSSVAACFRGKPLLHTRRKHNRPEVAEDWSDFQAQDEKYFMDPSLQMEYLCDLFANFWLLPGAVLSEIAGVEKSLDEKAKAQGVSVETLRNGLEYYAINLISQPERPHGA